MGSATIWVGHTDSGKVNLVLSDVGREAGVTLPPDEAERVGRDLIEKAQAARRLADQPEREDGDE